MENFEKLGAFYIGRLLDPESKELLDQLLLYDSKDLTTHAVCIGMTGSGKTGLCISLLEEAAIDGVPSIIIDPKGDMTNLLLTFPNLEPKDFLPWVNESEAAAKNMTPAEYAAKLAEQWRQGLQSWGQSGERIAMMRQKADFNIYTPGSTTGMPVSILKSFAAPPTAVLQDDDALNERVASTVGSLLGLLGIDADPIKSREHILLSTILRHFWTAGHDLDLARLIQSVQTPPVKQIGVFDVDSFFPPKDRFALAMMLNNFLAAPGFSVWLEGADLSPETLLYSPSGKPCCSIFYIAHLSDQERMFFVSLLLNQLVGWMRMQAGTPSLRMILYFDELFGYLPPIGEPPSKKPLLTLLKQGRAFGIGVVLATQNPVDLDYKALSNIGTWFIGRLQTERDRDRILDGLSSLSAGENALSRSELSKLITGLNKRQFLMHSVHEKGPVVFSSRWAMSYLYGPLTREQIKTLTSARPSPAPAEKARAKVGALSPQPSLPSEIRTLYLPVRKLVPEKGTLLYRPYLWGSAKLSFIDKTKGIDLSKEVRRITPISEGALAVDWSRGVEAPCTEAELSSSPPSQGEYEDVPQAAKTAKNYTAWQNFFIAYLGTEEKLVLYTCEELKITSEPGESEREFRIRLALKSRELRDAQVEAIRREYEKKIEALQNKVIRAEERYAREKAQADQQKLSTAISFGATVLGAFMGRKKMSLSTMSRAGSAFRNAGKTAKEAADVQRAQEELERLTAELSELQQELQSKVDALPAKADGSDLTLKPTVIRPNKTQITVLLVNFVWAPFFKNSDGELLPAF
ncbi:MAG: DUF87 domain-containing protein [candidate division KSB1 bacterium]|nr:DUF87 domain-containing protein [candidate division KSB1 bacterium]